MSYLFGKRKSSSAPDGLGESATRGSPAVSLSMRGGTDTSGVTPVRARILWPALGFPAVIAPRNAPGTSPFVEGDATRCLCVLVASNRRWLSKAEAARYLRIVPWAQRGKRHIPAGQPGSFREEEIAVHNAEQPPTIEQERPKDRLGGIVMFGANGEGLNGIAANLAKRVRDFYRAQGLEHLHEIRVYEHATARLPDGMHHLFWNNESTEENAPSDELALLLRQFARPRRERLGPLWRDQAQRLMREYEFEYGGEHLPYSGQGAPRVRAEILHPVRIQRNLPAVLRVGQLSDTHVDVRADVYEANLQAPPQPPVTSADQARYRANYRNWNKNFVTTYDAAKGDADVLLLTGDLVDYGRGYWGREPVNGVEGRRLLDKDGLYHEDRNWFLFSYLLASGDAYSKPVYTILGNHDWRINPYPPFATGAPSPATMFPDGPGFAAAEQKSALQSAHGNGHGRGVSYNDAVELKFRASWDTLLKPALSNLRTLGWQFLLKFFGGGQTLDEPGLPTETTVESVAWYLLSINPFLDYRFSLPRGHGVLMLDWAEDENVVFGTLYQGKRYFELSAAAADEGPTARNSLSDLQVELVKQFTDMPGAAKIIGIHAPPISPWDNWTDRELTAGWRDFDYGGRGYPHYQRTTADGRTSKGHPLFAIRPRQGVVPDAVLGMDAIYNTFEKNRPWFIKRIGDPRSGVRLVLSGHIHRRGLFVVFPAPENFGPKVAGELLIRSPAEAHTHGVRAPAASLMPVPRAGGQQGPATGPLYVISTSVGPRGHWVPLKDVKRSMDPGYTHLELANDGTIMQVTFRWVHDYPALARPIAVPSPAALFRLHAA